MEKKLWQDGVLLKKVTWLYDGWRLVREIEYGPNDAGTLVETVRRVYSWGPDVSGTLAGAAGIGGLLEVWETRGSTTSKLLPIDDGRGNITGLIDAATGLYVAGYDHGPFGEALDASGDQAGSCPLRWQTKYYDEETGLYYFGKRYYDPKTQSWLSRDPLREGGGVNPVSQQNAQGAILKNFFKRYNIQPGDQDRVVIIP